MSIQQNQIVQPTYNGQDIYYRTPVDAIITDGMSLDDYIRNTTGVVESGYKNSMYYIKFADGTILYYGSFSLSVTNNNAGYKTYTFPIEMYDVNYIVNITHTKNVAYFTEGIPCSGTRTKTSVQIGAYNTDSSTHTFYFDFYIIGRWKDYDASVLPDAQQSTIINSSSTNYYDDERVVGIWIDGKPIYRKVSNVTLQNESNWTNLVSIPNLDKLINAYGFCGNIIIPRYESSSYYTQFLFENNYLKYMSNGNSGSAFIVTEYTKTTDSPITSQTKDLLTVVNGKNITDLETIIQQRIDQLLENKLKEKLQQLK